MRESGRGIDRAPVFLGSPAAQDIVILERHTVWTHLGGTRHAHRGDSMPLYLLARGQLAPVGRRIRVERRDTRRWYRRRRVEQIGEHPFAAQNWRGLRRMRRDHEHAALAQYAAALPIVGEIDLAKSGSFHTRDAVQLREPLIQDSVIAGDHIEYAAVFTH